MMSIYPINFLCDLFVGQATLTLTYDGASFPTDASATFHWGDGMADTTLPVDGDTVDEVHSFSPGVYTTTCTVYNEVSQKVFTAQVSSVGTS